MQFYYRKGEGILYCVALLYWNFFDAKDLKAINDTHLEIYEGFE